MSADNPVCRFCGFQHPSCDLHHCYCGDTEPEMNGEGYNEKCNDLWLGKGKEGAS